MDFQLQDKVAMVAAASKGIGLAIAKGLADEGCKVSICGRTEETLEAAVGEISGDPRSYIVDVSNAADLQWWVDQTVADLGSPSILITNTGGPPAGPLETMTDEQWLSGIQSTLMNAIRLSNLVAPHMKAAGWGRIVHITSFVAKDPSQILPISSTLRAGLRSLTKLQAREWASSGITVNGVLPGHTMTDRQLHLADVRSERDGITPEEALDNQRTLIPRGDFATPEEIAAVAVFLCSWQASYLTGESILVDGGLSGGY